MTNKEILRLNSSNNNKIKYQYDLAIIGAGSGGYHEAIKPAKYRVNVALIEKNVIGDVYLNRGYILIKSLTCFNIFYG